MNFTQKMTVFLLSFTFFASSDDRPGFDSRKLSMLYEANLLDLKNPVSADTVYRPDSGYSIVKHFTKRLHGRLCAIKTEERSGVVVHEGLSLFNTDAEWEYNLVTRFIERFFLELLNGNENKEIEKAQTEQITLSFNGKACGKGGISDLSILLAVIESPVQYIIELNSDEFNRKYFRSIWKNSKNDSVVLTFPSRWDIISGKDKRELDSAISSSLRSYKFSGNFEKEIDNRKLVQLKNQLYVLKGNRYFEELSSDRYYMKRNGRYSHVVDIKFPKESVSNLLLCASDEGKHTNLDLTFRDNRDSTVHDTVPLNTVSEYFGRDHDCYIGFESQTSDTLAAVLVYVNKIYNNIHLISINFPKALINNRDNSILRAVIFTNIPNDNVSSLFGKYNLKKQKKYSVIIRKGDK